MYSQQKKRGTLKPHMIVLPDGSIIHMSKLHAADGHHNDLGLYNQLCNKEYLVWCRDNPTDTENPYRQCPEYLEGLLQFNLELYTPQDVAICDNGYSGINQKRVKCPRKCPKRLKRCKALWISYKRCISIIRNVVERVYANLKQFAILGTTLPVSELKHMNQIWVICAAYHNVYSDTFSKIENPRMEKLARRLIAMRNVPENPGRRWVPEKPKPQKPPRTAAVHSQPVAVVPPAPPQHNQQPSARSQVRIARRGFFSVQRVAAPAPPVQTTSQPAYIPANSAWHDAYTVLAKGLNNVVSTLQTWDWLMSLKLSVADIEDVLGQPFTIQYSVNYLHSLAANVQLAVHEDDPYVWRLSHMKSKYKSGVVHKAYLIMRCMPLVADNVCARLHDHSTDRIPVGTSFPPNVANAVRPYLPQTSRPVRRSGFFQRNRVSSRQRPPMSTGQSPSVSSSMNLLNRNNPPRNEETVATVNCETCLTTSHRCGVCGKWLCSLCEASHSESQRDSGRVCPTCWSLRTRYVYMCVRVTESVFSLDIAMGFNGYAIVCVVNRKRSLSKKMTPTQLSRICICWSFVVGIN